MPNYYRLLLGEKNTLAQGAFDGGYIGADYGLTQDLSGHLGLEPKAFRELFRPIWLQKFPDKSKIAAGLACGALWTVSQGISVGDVVFCRDTNGNYHVGTVTGGYSYAADQSLPHRRAVSWHPRIINKSEISKALTNSMGSVGTVADITDHHRELEALLEGNTLPPENLEDSEEDPSAFALEKHLEDFLVENWAKTELGKTYDIYSEDGVVLGKQFKTDVGAMDILAISKDKKELLVVELKKGKPSDTVVGQTLRYMGYAQEELAEEGQAVRGVIIALANDPKIIYALKMVPTVTFFCYQIDFKLVKG